MTGKKTWFGFSLLTPWKIKIKKLLVTEQGGNTHVTCHVGVSSCGQRHRNALSCLITFLHYC